MPFQQWIAGGRRHGRIAFSLMVLAMWPAVLTGPTGSSALRMVSAPLIVWQVPEDAAGATGAGLDRAGLAAGSRIIRLDGPEQAITNLTPGFASVGLPDLSRDGQRLLFVGRQDPRDAAAVWELSLENRALWRVMRCPGECERAIYLSTLYTMNDDAPVAQIAILSRSDEAGPAAMFRCALAGGRPQQITHSPDRLLDPLLLGDGRLLVFVEPANAKRRSDGVSREHGNRGTRLLTFNPDGTDVVLFGESPQATRRHSPTETPGGVVVYLEGTVPESALVRVRRADPTRPALRTRLTLLDLRNLVAIDDASVLAAGRPVGVEASFAIQRLSMDTGRSTVVFDDPVFHDVPAARVVSRPAAPGRSSVVDRKSHWGQLYALNAYASGSESSSVAQGTIARVRLHSLSSGAGERVIGEGEVERDGSFFAEIPPQTPIALELLDSSGRTIRRMESYFWIMPGERRGCIGCHENPALSPPNRHVFALRKPPQRIGIEGQPPDSRTGADRTQE